MVVSRMNKEVKRRMSNTQLQRKGDMLVEMIVYEYLKLGYFAIANYGHSEGVDVSVFSKNDGKIVAVCECKNYAKVTAGGKAEYVASETFKRDVDKLNAFDVLPNVEKWFIVSYGCILSYEQKEVLKLCNIKVREIGYEV
jgi:hypothetical protein